MLSSRLRMRYGLVSYSVSGRRSSCNCAQRLPCEPAILNQNASLSTLQDGAACFDCCRLCLPAQGATAASACRTPALLLAGTVCCVVLLYVKHRARLGLSCEYCRPLLDRSQAWSQVLHQHFCVPTSKTTRAVRVLWVAVCCELLSSRCCRYVCIAWDGRWREAQTLYVECGTPRPGRYGTCGTSLYCERLMLKRNVQLATHNRHGAQHWPAVGTALLQ